MARKMSQVYFNMGILGSSDYAECSASDLIGEYIGHSGPKTRDQLTQNLGRILFIDEAYRFLESQYGREAINELVDCLTKLRFMGKIVVILAGYTDHIDDLLRINPGLSSRFPEEVIFENMDPEKCLELLYHEITNQEMEIHPPLKCISPAERSQILSIFAELAKLPSWGNGRDVKNIAKNICSDAFAGTVASGLAVNTSTILRYLDMMLDAQKSRNKPQTESLSPDELLRSGDSTSLTQSLPRTQANNTAVKSKIKTEAPIIANEDWPNDKHDLRGSADSTSRDPGVSDEIWQQLQRDIVKEAVAKEARMIFIADKWRELEASKTDEEAGFEHVHQLERERCLASEKRRKQIEAELREEKVRVEAAAKSKREAEEKLKRAQEEAESKKREEAAAQEKIKEIGICPVGYRWIKQAGGYRCGGGSHFLSNSQLGL